MYPRERARSGIVCAQRTERARVAYEAPLSRQMYWLFFFFLTTKVLNAQFPDARRPVDLWNPFGTTTRRPNPSSAREDEIMVRTSVGVILGRKHRLTDLPWNVDHDPMEQVPDTRTHSDPDPVPTLNNATIYSFLGIPYAEPPITNRRFKPPQLMTQLPGEGAFLAFEYGASCPQDVESRPSIAVNDPYPFKIDEACLNLNIFTPDASTVSSRNYPVVAFFHGGNFQTGSANEWPGHILASRGIVVVTINYRLGPFGFMSLGDTETGNYGIQDQRCALNWIQQNIAAFGGDPQAVTIIGHDAGAVSAGIHMLAPLSKHLFRGVIAMSGSEVSYHSTIGKPALAFNNTIKLGRYLGCTQAVARHVWDCILTRSTNDIVQALSKTTVPSIPIEYNRYLFLPTIDNKELSSHPLWILNNVPTGGANIPSAVPYMTGLNLQDGAEVILEDRTLGEFTNFLEVDHSYLHSFIIEYSFRHNYTMNREAIIEAIEAFYTYWPDPADVWRIRQKFIELTTDAYYTAPIDQSAYLHSLTGSRTFFYVNSYNFSKTREGTVDRNSPLFPSWMGSCHDCDLYLLFGFPFMPKYLLPSLFKNTTWYPTDRNASQLFGFMFRQFVKYSNPNLPSDGKWPAYEPRAHWFLNFTYSEFDSLNSLGTVSRDYRYEQVAFWNHFIPSLVNYMTTTFPPSEVSVRRELVTFKVIVAVLTLILIIFMVLCLSFGYCLFDRHDYDKQTIDNRSLITRNSETPGSQHISMQRISSL